MKTYEYWLKYYENATKEQVIEDSMHDIEEITNLQQENKQLKEDLKDACYVIEKIKKEKQQAIEYIKDKKQFQQGCDTYQIIDWNYVLKILGDGINE